MAWIELHQELREHPKITRLGKLLGIKRREAIGLIVELWLWAASYASDGDLTDYDAEEIAQAAEWDTDAGILIDALVKVKLLDREEGRLTIHDWSEMGLRLLRSMRENKRRQRQAEDRPGADAPAETVSVAFTGQSRKPPADVSEPSQVCLPPGTETVSEGGERPSRPTDLTDPTDPSDRILVGDAPRREEAGNLRELHDAEFVLRLHEREFGGWILGVKRMIALENEGRRSNPFTWTPRQGRTFEAEMKELIYKLPDKTKLDILRMAYGTLGEKLNWPDYVELGIKYTLVSSRKKRVTQPIGFTVYALHHPGDLISARADGILAGVNMRPRSLADAQ